MADKKPLKKSSGITTEFETGDTLGIANGGTGATTKGAAVSNLLNESVTIANCSNTSSEVTVLSATVPANTWGDGEQFMLFGAFKTKQNSGVSRNLTLKIKVGGTSYTALSASAIANNATEGRSVRSLIFTRVGSEVWGSFGVNAIGLGSPNIAAGTGGVSLDQLSAGSIGNVWTGVDFTSSILLEYTVQWSAANSLTYFNPQVGRAVKL